MMGRLCEKVTFDIKHFVIAPEYVGQGEDVHLLQGLIEGVGLVLHTDSGQPGPSLVCLQMSSSPVGKICIDSFLAHTNIGPMIFFETLVQVTSWQSGNS